jgi:magnesium-transporting ATPase (P-type)
MPLLHPLLFSMKVDQSMITGESEPVESVVNAADPNALEARNIIFNGSLGEHEP